MQGHCHTSTHCSILCHSALEFFIDLSFWLHYGPGVDVASNSNEYQEYFLGGKGSWCVVLATFPPSCANCLEIWEPQPPGTLRACPDLYSDCFTKHLTWPAFDSLYIFNPTYCICNHNCYRIFKCQCNNTPLYEILWHSTTTCMRVNKHWINTAYQHGDRRSRLLSTVV